MAMTAHDTQHEEELARRVQHGDKVAFDRLVELCAPRVFNLAYRMMGNRDDADDIAQESFVRIFHALPKFKWESSFSTWLYRIVTNICYDEIKRRRARPRTLTDLQLDDTDPLDRLTARENVEEAWSRREEEQSLLQALTALPRDYRLIVVLADVQGMSYQEIAVLLSINIGTVKSRLNRARHQLREIFMRERELFCPSDSLNSG